MQDDEWRNTLYNENNGIKAQKEANEHTRRPAPFRADMRVASYIASFRRKDTTNILNLQEYGRKNKKYYVISRRNRSNNRG